MIAFIYYFSFFNGGNWHKLSKVKVWYKNWNKKNWNWKAKWWLLCSAAFYITIGMLTLENWGRRLMSSSALSSEKRILLMCICESQWGMMWNRPTFAKLSGCAYNYFLYSESWQFLFSYWIDSVIYFFIQIIILLFGSVVHNHSKGLSIKFCGLITALLAMSICAADVPWKKQLLRFCFRWSFCLGSASVCL